jgi:hypothetical protein
MTKSTNEYMSQYMRNRRLKRRDKIIQLLGGCCVRCESVDNLEIDHITPGSQEFRFSGKALDKPWQKLLDEAAKCQLFCHDCHRNKTIACGETGGGSNRIDDHATEAMYMKGCRCDPCRNARYTARVARGELKGTRGRYKNLSRVI